MTTAELSPAQMDRYEYSVSSLLACHRQRLVDYVRDHGGRVALSKVLQELGPELELTPRKMGVLLDASFDEVRMRGIESTVTLVQPPE